MKLSPHLYNSESECLQFCALVWALGHWKVSKREIQDWIFFFFKEKIICVLEPNLPIQLSPRFRFRLREAS